MLHDFLLIFLRFPVSEDLLPNCSNILISSSFIRVAYATFE